MKNIIEGYLTKIHSFIHFSRNKDGGWGYLPDKRSCTESTAWSVIFLDEVQEESADVKRGVKWLIQAQNRDGGWPNFKNHPSDIRTAHAIYALSGFGEEHDRIHRGIRWLKFNRRLTGGWAWSFGAFNFAEPTAYAILALQKMHSVVNKKPLADFLFDYQCEDGGWNSHSPVMLSVIQKGQVSVTPWALLALKRLEVDAKDKRIVKALRFLEFHINHLESLILYSKSLALWVFSEYRRSNSSKLVFENILRNIEQCEWRNNILWISLLGISLQKYRETF